MPTRAAAQRAGAGPALRAPVHVRRMLTLLALVVVMGLVLAPILSGYLQQRAEISATHQRIEDERAAVADLEEELARWEDDTYVERQARERLRFVKEGETSFTVIDDTGSEYAEALPGMAPVSEDTVEEGPWYGQVWESVQVANEGLPQVAEP